METWEQVLVGAAGLIILFLFWPGASRAIEDSPKGTLQDWMGVIKPLAVVVAFVFLLIALL